ncbi:hypothetical protein [Mycolicibacterium sp.]|uniref:hypothetical protein n=1 Tax=Mycolicibacterium sp. TaxID=2320850 RepID=UPI00355FE19B
MKKPANKPAKVAAGNLIFNCEICDWPVTEGQGFLTIDSRSGSQRKFRIYHDYCAKRDGVQCGYIPTATGNRPCRINVGLIATPELFLNALAGLAIELRDTDWLRLVQKVVWDTEYYFDPEGLDGGKRSLKKVIAENQLVYAKAGVSAYAGRIELDRASE